jgi:hypothetical protein
MGLLLCAESQNLCRFDVPLLGTLVATAQKNNQLLSALHEVDPVTRALVNSHFTDTITNGLNVTRVAKLKTVDPSCDLGSCAGICQSEQPFREGTGLANFHHRSV